jgi:hypothetical protein
MGRVSQGGSGGGGGGGGVEILWYTNWSYLTGSSDEALSDNGKFNTFYCQQLRANVMRVVNIANEVPGGSAAWGRNQPNAMRLTQRGVAYCGSVEVEGSAIFLPENTDFYMRMFVRTEDGFSHSMHGIAMNAVGTIQYVPVWVWGGPVGSHPDPRANIQSGKCRFAVHLGRDQNGSTSNIKNYWSPELDYGWYLYELHVEHFGQVGSLPQAIKMHPRISTVSGNLLYDEDDFFDSSFPFTETLGDVWAAGQRYIGITDTTLAREFSVGYEGTGPDNGAHCWVADVAFSLQGWIGTQEV